MPKDTAVDPGDSTSTDRRSSFRAIRTPFVIVNRDHWHAQKLPYRFKPECRADQRELRGR
jgi:hypothetical protein